ncbi:MAG: lysophospholipid acyltransferase family protein [Chloroflexota bacterium]
MTITENEMVDRRKQINYPLTETGFHRFLVSSLRTVFNLVMTLEINGQNNIPLQGAVILAANHVTNLDIFPLQLAVNRPIFFMGKSELFKNPLLHYAFRNLGAFPVYRGERDEWAISHSKKILQAGQVLGMFPEGTRSRGRGLRVAKTGAARLALELGYPIVPVGIDGSHTFFKQFPRRNLVKINIGEPLWPEPGELPIGLTDRVMFELARNLPADLRGVYA